MKYIVMECHIGYAVVLDEDGRFLKVANRNYQVGIIIRRIVSCDLSGIFTRIRRSLRICILCLCEVKCIFQSVQVITGHRNIEVGLISVFALSVRIKRIDRRSRSHL